MVSSCGPSRGLLRDLENFADDSFAALLRGRRSDCDKSPRLSGRDIVIINVSPIDLGHCLLVPQMESCLPQV